jgi:phage-related protein (TIGR01555 family)
VGSELKIAAFDSFINFLSGLGTSKDKQVYSQFQTDIVPRQEIDAAYRTDWIARKIVDCPPQDATREWRKWMGADADLVEQLEQKEADLNIPRKVRQALCWSRLYGGAALILGVDQGKANQELDIERIKKDDLKFIHVVSRYGIGIENINRDIRSPYFNEPEYYTKSLVGATSVSSTDLIRIHPSRVVAFRGLPLADDSTSDEGWGDSILQVAMGAVKSCALVSGSIATMVNEAKLDVIKVPDLSRHMSTQEYKDLLTARFMYANMAKSVINTILLDKEEEWDRIDTQFSALPEILRMFLLITSGAADIPATRMLGQSPAGLSSTGESDTRNYYDRIASEQENELTPTLNRLDEILIRSTFGRRDPKIYYEWNPLWQTSDLDKSIIFKNKSDTYRTDVDMGLIDLEALRIGRQNQLIEDGVYPGLDRALEKQELLALESMMSPDEQEKEAIVPLPPLSPTGFPSPNQPQPPASGKGNGSTPPGQ